jgi:hypothetical protein
MQHTKLFARAIALAVRRPLLLPVMVAAAWRFRRRAWWRHAPFLPLPSRQYMAWRLDTAFGASGSLPEREQLERYLRWTRDMSTRP